MRPSSLLVARGPGIHHRLYLAGDIFQIFQPGFELFHLELAVFRRQHGELLLDGFEIAPRLAGLLGLCRKLAVHAILDRELVAGDLANSNCSPASQGRLPSTADGASPEAASTASKSA